MSIFNKKSFQFIKDLKKNNNREWFAENKPRYQAAYQELKDFKEALLPLMSKHDEIEEIKLFRIYRDVRFSKNKDPYKTHLSGHAIRATKWRRGGYYFHIEPGGNSMIAGGFWAPEKEDLKRIRIELAADAQPFRKIINAKKFKDTFGELTGEQLKTAPRGYEKDHPNVDLLRYKQFLVFKQFTDQEVLSSDFVKNANKVFKAMRPFFDYMSDVLTTDENGVPLE